MKEKKPKYSTPYDKEMDRILKRMRTLEALRKIISGRQMTPENINRLGKLEKEIKILKNDLRKYDFAKNNKVK